MKFIQIIVLFMRCLDLILVAMMLIDIRVIQNLHGLTNTGKSTLLLRIVRGIIMKTLRRLKERNIRMRITIHLRDTF